MGVVTVRDWSDATRDLVDGRDIAQLQERKMLAGDVFHRQK
jgi:hypothetical protein